MAQLAQTYLVTKTFAKTNSAEEHTMKLTIVVVRLVFKQYTEVSHANNLWNVFNNEVMLIQFVLVDQPLKKV